MAKGFSLCRAARAARKTTRRAGGWQRCHAAKLLPPQDGDCSGRRPREEGEHHGTEGEQPCAHEMDVQVPHRVLTKAWEKGHLQPIPEGPGGDPQEPLPVEGGGDNRRASDAGPCAHAGEHPAQDQRVELHGVPEGEERAPHVRQGMRTSSTGSGTGSSGQRATMSRPSA
jgi:hypothetical protein